MNDLVANSLTDLLTDGNQNITEVDARDIR